MNNVKDIYLGSITHLCGDWLPINELPSLHGKEDALDTISYLENLGLRRYSKFNTPLGEVIKSGLKKTLKVENIDGSDIDATIFFSTTYDPYVSDGDIAAALEENGLQNAVSYGMFHNQCSNYSQALELAQLLCITGKARNVLIFGYDAIDESRSDRVLAGKTSIYSDVYVGCMVTIDREKSDYKINNIVQRFHPEVMRLLKGGNALQFLMKYSECFKKVCDTIYNEQGTTSSSYAKLVTANYNFSVIKNLAELAGFQEPAVYMNNVGRYAHCFSADQLVALEEMQGMAESGSRMLLTAVGGFVLFSAIDVERL